jgi:hypothetical protein
MFSDKLGAMIEPVFKYQLNTLKKRDVADFRPYNLGFVHRHHVYLLACRLPLQGLQVNMKRKKLRLQVY